MKAEVQDIGVLLITAETVAEAHALMLIGGLPAHEAPCDKCGQHRLPHVLDVSILGGNAVVEEGG